MTTAIRRKFKRSVESILSKTYASHVGQHVMAGRTLILAYHNVFPNESEVMGDVSLHLSRRAFADQLDLLQERCQVIPLTQVREPQADGTRPRVVITFDDAYWGALTVGVEELTRRKLPATIFVAPGLLGQSTLWWDELAAALPRAEFDARRERWLTEFEGDGNRIRRAVRTGGSSTLTPSNGLRPGTVAELAWAAQQPGITIGSHSWSHRNLSRVAQPRLERELSSSKQWLEQRFKSFIPWLAYPYGHYSKVVAREAQRAGYHGALAVAGGWLPRQASNPYELPRYNIPRGMSLDGFAVRLSGLFC